MWNNTNPAELYTGTTWELISSNKYIQSGSTALQTGGSNSITIGKANLPNIQLQVNSFNLTRGTMDITGTVKPMRSASGSASSSGALTHSYVSASVAAEGFSNDGHNIAISFQASKNWTGSTSSASPYTQALGSGTALSIQPSYITLKFWKRLT